MNRISTIQGHGQPGCRRADRGGAAADRMAALLKRVFIFIAIMLTTASGAWAAKETLLTTITPDGSGNPVYSVANKATIAKDGILYGSSYGWYATTARNLTVTACEGIVITKVKFTTNQGATWEDTAAPFQVKLQTLKVYDSDDSALNGSGVNKIEVYGYEATTYYSVTLADGTEDAANWQAKVGEGEFTVLPVTGLEGGETVTIQYNGTRRIKSITAVQTAAAEEQQEEAVTAATPLTMECLSDGTIKVDMGSGTLSTGMQYAVNGGTKTKITTTTTIEGLTTGDKVQFYGVGTDTQAYGDNPEVKISGGSAQVKVYGNIMSLLDETGFATKTDLPNSNYVFYGLFKENANLTDASGLLLPATTLAKNCYRNMFNSCTALTAAPELPATTLAESCYGYMFYGCTALTAAPELPATTLAESCYFYMFYGCTKLASVTCKATDITANNCLYKWLSGAGTDASVTSPTLYVTDTNKFWYNDAFIVTAIQQ